MVDRADEADLWRRFLGCCHTRPTGAHDQTTTAAASHLAEEVQHLYRVTYWHAAETDVDWCRTSLKPCGEVGRRGCLPEARPCSLWDLKSANDTLHRVPIRWSRDELWREGLKGAQPRRGEALLGRLACRGKPHAAA